MRSNKSGVKTNTDLNLTERRKRFIDWARIDESGTKEHRQFGTGGAITGKTHPAKRLRRAGGIEELNPLFCLNSSVLLPLAKRLERISAQRPVPLSAWEKKHQSSPLRNSNYLGFAN